MLAGKSIFLIEFIVFLNVHVFSKSQILQRHQDWVLSSSAKVVASERDSLCSNIEPFRVSDIVTAKNRKFPLKNSEVILTSTSAQILPFVVNFVLSLYRLCDHPQMTIKAQFIIVAFDAETIDLCDKLWLPCWYPGNLFGEAKISGRNGLYSDYGSSIFNERTLVLTRIIYMLLEAGANILSCDADSVLLQPPHSYFARAGSNMHLFISGNTVDNLNTGYFYARRSPFTVKLFGDMYKQCKDDNIDDQKCLNKLLARRGLSFENVMLLPSDIFPTTGCVWGRLNQSARISAHLFHASCQLGLQKKLLFFRKHNMVGIECMRVRIARRLEQRGTYSGILNGTTSDLVNISSSSLNLRDFLNRIYSNTAAW